MNRVEVSGRLTRDPELRMVGAKDFPICTLSLGVEDADGRWNPESKKTEVGSGFYRVEVIGALGEELANTLNKGDLVYVLGSLNQYSVGGKGGTEKQSKTQIKATVVTVLSQRTAPKTIEAPADPLVDDSWSTEPF